MPHFAAIWKDLEDVPQDVLNRAADCMIELANGRNTRNIGNEEVNAILCALSPFSTAASNWLDPS